MGKSEDVGSYTGMDNGLQGNKVRGHLHVIILHIGIRIRYMIESWFYLKPLLSSSLTAYPSILRPKGIPKVDWPTLFAIRMLWLFGAIVRTHRIFLPILLKFGIMQALQWFHARLMVSLVIILSRSVSCGHIDFQLQDRISRIMRESDVDWERCREIQIPEYDWKNGNPEEFYNTFVKTPHPVVLRGFIKDTPLTKEYTFDNFVEKYAEETVFLLKPDRSSYMGKVKELRDTRLYLQNCEVLFNKHPELLSTLHRETVRLEPYLKKECGYGQLFVGSQGNGAPLHNAGTWNFFHMVNGSKKWYFIDPYDYYFASPMWVWGQPAAAFGQLFPDEFDKKKFPHMQYLPYYVTELQAGDILLNPPWWGHGIRNTSKQSVAVATRWYPNGVVGDNLKTTEDNYEVNRFGSFIFHTGIRSFFFLQKILYEPSPKFDEHVTLRERQAQKIERDMLEMNKTRGNWKPTF